MTEAKFRDIIATMVEMGILDPVKAIVNQDYFVETFNQYVKCANIAREMMHMEPLV